MFEREWFDFFAFKIVYSFVFDHFCPKVVIHESEYDGNDLMQLLKH